MTDRLSDRAPERGWVVRGRDTFAGEDFVVAGPLASRDEAEARAAAERATAAHQPAELRDEFWVEEVRVAPEPVAPASAPPPRPRLKADDVMAEVAAALAVLREQAALAMTDEGPFPSIEVSRPGPSALGVDAIELEVRAFSTRPRLRSVGVRLVAASGSSEYRAVSGTADEIRAFLDDPASPRATAEGAEELHRALREEGWA